MAKSKRVDVNSSVANTPTYFPQQQQPDSKKNEAFFKDCVNAGIAMTWWNLNSINGVRPARKNKIINYNLYNDIVDKFEIERVTNPFRLDDTDFPAKYRNYPLLNQNIMVLLGEERKRMFNPTVVVINEDAVNQKLGAINDEFNKWAVEKVTSGKNLTQQQLEEEIQQFNTWRLTFKDRRERMVQQMLDYAYRTQYLKETFSRGFEDLLIGGEEIYVADIYGGEPRLRKGNPLSFYTLRSGESCFIEDSDIIVEDGFLPLGEVLDRFHEDLTDAQIAELESGHQINRGGQSMSLVNPPSSLGEYLYTTGLTDNIGDVILANRDLTFTYGGYFDTEGNIRVTRVVWKGMRKIGVLTYRDEFGDELKKFVPEQYKPVKERGEQVEWHWVGEWYEGTRIGFDIYVKMQVLPTQSRHMDNPSICSPGIIGTVATVNANRGKSLMDIGKDYQYLYNTFMYRLEHLVIKNKGKIAKMPLHLIPDGWTIDKAMYYAEIMGWLPTDAFNEGTKGQSLGKLAGNVGDNSTVIDLSFSQDIAQCVQLLEFVKRQCDDLTGITPQRKGAVDNRETVGGVERAVTQSSLSTEKWYGIHDNTKVRALKAYIEVCKVAWKGKSFKRTYVLDDGSQAILDFDGELFAESEYAIDISTATSDMELMQQLRSSTDRLMQSGTPLSIVIDMWRTKDPTTLQRKIAAWEEQQSKMKQQELEAQQQQVQAQLAAQQQQHEELMQLEYDKLDREDMNAQLDREERLQQETIKALSFDTNKDENANGIPDVLEQSKLALEHVKTSYDKSLKERELRLKEKQHNDEVALRKKEIQLSQKEIASREKIARMKPKPKAK